MKRQATEEEAHAEDNADRHSARFAVRLGLFVLMALLALPVARLVHMTIYRAKAFASTACWYLGHRQLEADARTVAAMIDYVLSDDSEVVIGVVATNCPAVPGCDLESPEA